MANPNYAHIRYSSGRESIVSLRDLAPYGNDIAMLNFENSNTSDDAIVNDCVSSQSNFQQLTKMTHMKVAAIK